MENRPEVYIISGPPGAGKSTASILLSEKYEKSAVIEGDMVYLMVRKGNVAPWLDDGTYVSLFLENVLALTDNFLRRGITVIIDYVLFPHHMDIIKEHYRYTETVLKYAVLLADEKTVRYRDSLRPEIERCGETALMSLSEFRGKSIDPRFIIETEDMAPDRIVDEINRSNRFVFE